jgi:4,5-dihydroxyphthalate decarboxylase
MAKLPLTIAVSDYDHVRDFANGVVAADGIEATFLTLTIEEIFQRFIQLREWHVSETSFGKYVALRSQGDDSLTAIPVFPSRMFRLSSLYVRADGPVARVEDLAGRKVGVPEWAQTAAIYTRGYLVHQLGIPLADIEWFQAGVSQAGRVERVRLNLPGGVRLTPVADRSLQDLLLAGEIDAIMTAHPPSRFEDGDGAIVQLVPDYQPAEEAYFRETGIFPIMHTITVRRDVADAHPWALMNLFTAFEEAKRRSVARAFELTASRFPIPWSAYHAAWSASMFDGEYWPYGVDANRRTLDAFLQHAHEQGVCHRRLGIEDLFPEGVRSRVRV